MRVKGRVFFCEGVREIPEPYGFTKIGTINGGKGQLFQEMKGIYVISMRDYFRFFESFSIYFKKLNMSVKTFIILTS